MDGQYSMAIGEIHYAVAQGLWDVLCMMDRYADKHPQADRAYSDNTGILHSGAPVVLPAGAQPAARGLASELNACGHTRAALIQALTHLRDGDQDAALVSLEAMENLMEAGSYSQREAFQAINNRETS